MSSIAALSVGEKISGGIGFFSAAWLLISELGKVMLSPTTTSDDSSNRTDISPDQLASIKTVSNGGSDAMSNVRCAIAEEVLAVKPQIKSVQVWRRTEADRSTFGLVLEVSKRKDGAEDMYMGREVQGLVFAYAASGAQNKSQLSKIGTGRAYTTHILLCSGGEPGTVWVVQSADTHTAEEVHSIELYTSASAEA
jgi:hypothetical protein